MYAEMWILFSVLLVPTLTLPSPGISDPQLSAWYLANEYYPPGVERPRGHHEPPRNNGQHERIGGPIDGITSDATWRQYVDIDKERPEPDPDPDEYGTTYPTLGYTDAYYSGRDWDNEYDEYDDGNGDEYDYDYAANAEAVNTRSAPEETHRPPEERPRELHDDGYPRIGSLGMNGPFPMMPSDTHLRRAKRDAGKVQGLSNEISSPNKVDSEEYIKDDNPIAAPVTNKLTFKSRIISDETSSDKNSVYPKKHRKKRGFYSEALHRHAARKNAWKNKLGVFGSVQVKEDLANLRRTKRGLLSREMDAPSYGGDMSNDEELDERDDEALHPPQSEEYDALHPLPIPPPGTEKKVWKFENVYDPFSADIESDYEEDSNDDSLGDYSIEPSGIVRDTEYSQYSNGQDSSEMENHAFGVLDSQTDMSSEMQTNPVGENGNTSPGFIQDYESYPSDDVSSMEEAMNFSYEQMGTASMSRPTRRMHRRPNRRFRRHANHKTARGYASSSEETGDGSVQPVYVDPRPVSRGYISDNFRGKRSSHTVPFHRHRDQRVSYPVGQVGVFGVERHREDLSTIRRA